MLRDPKPTFDAELIGLYAFNWLAGDGSLTQRFLDLTGIDPSNMRAEADRPGFLVDLLDFYLGHEPDVLDLASQLAVPPAAIGQARNTLAKRAGLPLVDFPS